MAGCWLASCWLAAGRLAVCWLLAAVCWLLAAGCLAYRLAVWPVSIITLHTLQVKIILPIRLSPNLPHAGRVGVV